PAGSRTRQATSGEGEARSFASPVLMVTVVGAKGFEPCAPEVRVLNTEPPGSVWWTQENESEPVPMSMKNPTTLERPSDVEFRGTRTFDAPARFVFEAWTKPELLKQWWVPKSIGMTLASCEADVRAGGTYRFVFGLEGSKTMAFFGKYLEVIPHARLVWTN